MKINLKIQTLLITTILAGTAVADNARDFHHDPMNAKKMTRIHNEGKHKALKNIGNPAHMSTRTKHQSNTQFVMVKEIDLQGVVSMPAESVKETLMHLVGGKASIATIEAATQKITQYYQDHGQLLTLAYIPEQDFKNGVVRINVLEGNIRDVKVEGDAQSPVFKEYVDKILALNPVTKKQLVRYLQLMNKIPGYEVAYQLQPLPKSKVNVTNGDVADLVLQVTRKNGTGSINGDNYGAKELGKAQGSLAAELLSPFNKDESLLGFVVTTNKPNKLVAGTVGAKKIINSEGTAMQVMASVATNSANAPVAAPKKHDMGTVVRASFTHYPVLTNKTSLELEAGLQNKTQKTHDGNVKLSQYNIMSAFVGAKFEHDDSFGGSNLFTPTVYKAMPGASNSKVYSDTITKYSKSYTLVNGGFERDQALAGPMTLFFAANGQYTSDKNLPIEEKFSVGGLINGRGYKLATISTNKGAGASAELRFTAEPNADMLKSAQLYGFYEMVGFSKTQAQTTFSKLGSAGVGTRLGFGYDIGLGFEVAQPMKKHIVVAGSDVYNKTKFSVTLDKVFSW